MLPSFITSVMTLINIDYRYFAGSRDPIDIINKYRSRGYSVILNSNEKKGVSLYNKSIDSFNGMFKAVTDEECFGPKDLNNKIYKPGVYKLGLPEEIYKKSTHRYIRNIGELYKRYKLDINRSFNILEYTAISSTGTINPYQQWIADAYYNMCDK
jgi:hypothetical protein